MSDRKSYCKKKIDVEAETVTFTFEDGRVIVFYLSEMSQAQIRRLALFGANHKIGDSYSQAKSVDDAHEAAFDTLDVLKDGGWSQTKSSTGGMFIEALSRLTGQPIEDCKVMFDGLDEKAQDILRKEARVVAMVATIRAEKAAAKAAKATSGMDLAALFQPKE